MMDLEIQRTMRAAISEVLETMFFIIADYGEDGAPIQFYDYESRTSLSNEEKRMDISFKITGPFARTITANLLGVHEEEVTPDDLEDTMKELANMVGGNQQARLEGTRWQLSIPHFQGREEQEDAYATGFTFSCLGKPLGKVTWQFESSRAK